MESVFETWAYWDAASGRPHYPKYSLDVGKIGTAASRDKAEELIAVAVKRYDHLHHFLVKEVPLDIFTPMSESVSEYVYDMKGNPVDSLWVSSIPGKGCRLFGGRTPEQIRFAPGDIVEVHSSDSIRLGIVASTPMSVEEADIAIKRGWKCTVAVPSYMGDCFTLEVESPTGRQDMRIQIRDGLVYGHPEKVRATLFRLAGKKTPVRGYHVIRKTIDDLYGEFISIHQNVLH